MLRNN